MDMRLLLQGFQVLLMVWTAWYAWSTSRQAARQHQVNTLATSLADINTRVTRLEEQVRHFPDDLVHGLAGDMKALQAQMEGVRQALAPLARSVERMNDFLLTQK